MLAWHIPSVYQMDASLLHTLTSKLSWLNSQPMYTNLQHTFQKSINNNRLCSLLKPWHVYTAGALALGTGAYFLYRIYFQKHIDFQKQKKVDPAVQHTKKYTVVTSEGLPAGRIILKFKQNITTESEADAIVNATKERGLGGGGVDGAIHRAAGPELRTFNEKLPQDPEQSDRRCPEGQARISPAYKLATPEHPIKYVISSTGPKGDNPQRESLISGCYRSCLQLAAYLNLHKLVSAQKFSAAWNTQSEHDIKAQMALWDKNFALFEKQQLTHPINTLIFPAISAKIFGYNIEDSAPRVIPEIIKSMQTYASLLGELQKEGTDLSIVAQLNELKPLTVILTLYGHGQDAMKLYQNEIESEKNKKVISPVAV